MKTFVSDLSKKEFLITDRVAAKAIRQSIKLLIKKDYPDFSSKHYISYSELNVYRQKYISNYLINEIGHMTELENTVLNSLQERKTISDKVEEEHDRSGLTYGQRVSDNVAHFGGSWTFILSFLGFIILWIIVNIFWLVNRSFDPFPFILLNLILSCLAALQAPVIMMSQKRQEEKDRETNKKDYMINLKSELEIRMLHEKLDHLIMNQQQELIEIQKMQMEIMHDILNKVEKNNA